jgi:hypothetical protein
MRLGVEYIGEGPCLIGHQARFCGAVFPGTSPDFDLLYTYQNSPFIKVGDCLRLMNVKQGGLMG